MIAIGIVGVGMLVFTLLSRVAIPLTFSESLDDNGGITATRGEPDSYRPGPVGI